MSDAVVPSPARISSSFLRTAFLSSAETSAGLPLKARTASFAGSRPLFPAAFLARSVAASMSATTASGSKPSAASSSRSSSDEAARMLSSMASSNLRSSSCVVRLVVMTAARRHSRADGRPLQMRLEAGAQRQVPCALRAGHRAGAGVSRPHGRRPHSHRTDGSSIARYVIGRI
jgi:hypothetical protein